jgi:TPR repeat protein
VAAQPAEAARWLRQGTEGGVPRAPLQWAGMLFIGDGGVPADRAQARRWMEASARGGEAHAQWLIGAEWPRRSAPFRAASPLRRKTRRGQRPASR